uniref:Putative transcriptional regulator dj-1 n=1 Tax=Anopheles braziliensis TaxID=58242 RepID=A0A2M3ZJ26_9DIPT
MATSVANQLKKRALALLATGSEEMELVVAVDVLRRCDIDVTVALVQDGDGANEHTSNADLVARCSRNVGVQADVTLAKYLADHISDEASLPDAIILPGGLEGSRAMSKAPAVGELLRHYQNSAKIVAAICAAPTVFAAQGNLFAGRRLTSYPAFKDTLNGAGYAWQEPEQSANGRVVRDGNLITSMGPATSFDFALTVGAALTGQETAEKVASAMLYKWPH